MQIEIVPLISFFCFRWDQSKWGQKEQKLSLFGHHQQVRICCLSHHGATLLMLFCLPCNCYCRLVLIAGQCWILILRSSAQSLCHIWMSMLAWFVGNTSKARHRDLLFCSLHSLSLISMVTCWMNLENLLGFCRTWNEVTCLHPQCSRRTPCLPESWNTEILLFARQLSDHRSVFGRHCGE